MNDEEIKEEFVRISKKKSEENKIIDDVYVAYDSVTEGLLSKDALRKYNIVAAVGYFSLLNKANHFIVVKSVSPHHYKIYCVGEYNEGLFITIKNLKYDKGEWETIMRLLEFYEDNKEVN